MSYCGAVEGYGIHHKLYPEEVFKAFDPVDRREVGSLGLKAYHTIVIAAIGNDLEHLKST